MESKRYYSISEVTKILEAHDYQLRYLEKISPNFIIYKIRGRRYYTNKDIEFLKNLLQQNNKDISTTNNYTKSKGLKRAKPLATKLIKPLQLELQEVSSISNKIDSLINKFNKLSIGLKEVMASS